MAVSESDYLLPEEKKTQYSSFFKSFGPDRNATPDKETLHDLAALMGVNLAEIERKVAETERLHRLAWQKKKRKGKDAEASPPTHYELITEFDGKQLFWQVGADQFLVNVGGRTRFEETLKGALHQLACA